MFWETLPGEEKLLEGERQLMTLAQGARFREWKMRGDSPFAYHHENGMPDLGHAEMNKRQRRKRQIAST